MTDTSNMSIKQLAELFELRTAKRNNELIAALSEKGVEINGDENTK